MTSDTIISHFQTKPLLHYLKDVKQLVNISLDLGLTTSQVELTPEGVILQQGQLITWDSIKEINKSKNNCFQITSEGVDKIVKFSQATNQSYSLMPTESAPTMLISGIPMHRIKGTDPHQDTLEKIKAVKPISGHVLDTATGLGYTAIEAAKYAKHVTTIEINPVALDIAKCNPWSRTLFDNPQINQMLGDSFELIKEFEDGCFTCIIHDPPAFSLAGHLYGGEFYLELCRVLKKGGRLFHYIGNPESKSGRNTTQGVLHRLRDAGFRGLKRRSRAFGVVATK
jgi:predicted methyltransferase